MKAFSGAVELRGPYAPGHHQRVAYFAHAIAKEMGLPDLSVEGLWLAAHVYDISLVNMPVEILLDAGQLTGHSLTLYRNYPQLSYDILKKSISSGPSPTLPCNIASVTMDPDSRGGSRGRIFSSKPGLWPLPMPLKN